MTTTFLDRIVATTRADLAERQERTPPDELRAQLADAPRPRPFATTLRPDPTGSARLIGEIKRASPSKGIIADSFEPVVQARAYERGGASAISVLTEPRYFLGSLDHLRAVRATVDLPILRKDFILDPYQVYEARAAGADAVLLICALLDDAQLADLLALTHSLGMEALVEGHDGVEVRRAVAVGARIIGVNSRDLRTFEVHPDIVQRLRPLAPPDRIFVAESGIASATDAARARAFGADAILVGEVLMRAADPAAKAHELATAPGGTISYLFKYAGRPFTKICGLVAPEQVQLAAECGADAIGLLFAPQALPHRRVTPEQAKSVVCASKARSFPHADPPFPRGAGGQGVRSPFAIGVFVNEEPDRIAQIAARVGLDAIQLAGDETARQCAEVIGLTERPVLKSLRLRDEADLAQLDAYAMAGAVLLLDAHVPGSYGGSGVTGDWDLARRASQRWPVILSGGLTPENVAEAILYVRPYAVDVASGVESRPGKKDPGKLRAFLAEVDRANREFPT